MANQTHSVVGRFAVLLASVPPLKMPDSAKVSFSIEGYDHIIGRNIKRARVIRIVDKNFLLSLS